MTRPAATPGRPPSTPPIPAWWAAPAGSTPARSSAGWLRAAHDAIDAAQLRADADRGLRQLVWLLARHANWHTPLLTRPTWALLAQRTGRSRRWVCARLAWLRHHGLLGVAETGSTPHTRGCPDDGRGNRAAVYLLCQPHFATPASAALSAARPGRPSAVVDETCAPPRPHRGLGTSPRAREPGTHRSLREPGGFAIRTTPATTGAAGRQPDQRVPRRPPPRPGTRRHRHQQAAAQLHAFAPATRRLSVAHLAALLHPHLEAGWTVPDLLYALDHPPDGRQHWHTTPIRAPAGWTRTRLTHWATPTGQIGPSRTQQLAAAAAAHRAQAAANAADHARTRTAAATPSQARAHAANTRAALAALRARRGA